MNPLISIITVNYNNEIGLQKTIESVIDQTSKNFEFIVIDGASIDGSKALIDRYQQHFAHSRSESDNGIYHAMNKGIKIAEGQFLLFLNSGDALASNTILEQVEPHLNPAMDIVYGNAAYLEPQGKVVRTYPSELSFEFFFNQNLSHQASFIKKSLFSDLFFYNETYKIVSDWEFFMYSICKANVAYKHIDLVICDYDVLGISSITTNHATMNEERRQTLTKYFPLFIKDYEGMKVLKSKRGKQFLYIKDHSFAFKILKGMMNLILFFLPKAK